MNILKKIINSHKVQICERLLVPKTQRLPALKTQRLPALKTQRLPAPKTQRLLAPKTPLNAQKVALKAKLALGQTLSHIAFTNSCIICSSKASYIPLCSNCQNRLEKETRQSMLLKRCKFCGKELISEKDTCLDCRKDEMQFVGFESVFPVFTYLLHKKNLLFEWKIAGNRSLVFFYAKLFNCVIEEKYKNIPIVPIPPRPKKIKSKGWDQIAELSKVLECFYSVKVLNLLERITGYEQKKQDKENRFLLSKTAFRINQKAVKNLIIPESVLLIDDIITTGATIITCKDLLHSLGVKKVNVMSLLKVP